MGTLKITKTSKSWELTTPPTSCFLSRFWHQYQILALTSWIRTVWVGDLIIWILISLYIILNIWISFSVSSFFFPCGSSRMLKIIWNVVWVNPTVPLVTHLGLTSGEGEGVAPETYSYHHCPKDRVREQGLPREMAFPDQPHCLW